MKALFHIFGTLLLATGVATRAIGGSISIEILFLLLGIILLVLYDNLWA